MAPLCLIMLSRSTKAWCKLLQSFCHPGLTKRLLQSLGQWTTTIHTSQRLWPFYYSSTTEILYRGYREDWHSNMKYQFDGYKRDDNDVFAFEPDERNVELKYIPKDAVPVDIATARHGWIICHFHTLQPQSTVPTTAPPTNLLQFIKSQPAYISQYYVYIK